MPPKEKEAMAALFPAPQADEKDTKSKADSVPDPEADKDIKKQNTTAAVVVEAGAKKTGKATKGQRSQSTVEGSDQGDDEDSEEANPPPAKRAKTTVVPPADRTTQRINVPGGVRSSPAAGAPLGRKVSGTAPRARGSPAAIRGTTVMRGRRPPRRARNSSQPDRRPPSKMSGRATEEWRRLNEIYESTGSLDSELKRLKEEVNAQAFEAQAVADEVKRTKASWAYKKRVLEFIESYGSEITPQKIKSGELNLKAMQDCLNTVVGSSSENNVERQGEVFRERSPGGTDYYEQNGYEYYYYPDSEAGELSAWRNPELVPEYLGGDLVEPVEVEGEEDEEKDYEEEKADSEVGSVAAADDVVEEEMDDDWTEAKKKLKEELADEFD